jgi:hypothetical protein
MTATWRDWAKAVSLRNRLSEAVSGFTPVVSAGEKTISRQRRLSLRPSGSPTSPCSARKTEHPVLPRPLGGQIGQSSGSYTMRYGLQWRLLRDSAKGRQVRSSAFRAALMSLPSSASVKYRLRLLPFIGGPPYRATHGRHRANRGSRDCRELR